MSKNKKSQRTHAEILDVAWDLIASKGASVSMADIAAAAQMTRQSIYVHFGSRGGLLFELVKRADERFGIWDDFGAAMKEQNPAARLDAVLSAWLRFVPKIHPVATDLIRLRSGDRDAEIAWGDRMTDLLAFYRVLVTQLEKEKVLAKGWTVDTAADFIWVTSSMQSWDLYVNERFWSPQAAARQIRKTIVTTLLA